MNLDFDGKAALIVRGCLCEPVMRLEHGPHVVQTGRDIEMLLGAMYLDFDGKAALIVCACLDLPALRIAQPTERMVAAGHLERLLGRPSSRESGCISSL